MTVCSAMHPYMYLHCCDENSCVHVVPVSSIQDYSRSDIDIEPEVTVPQAGTSGSQDSTLSACMFGVFLHCV